MPSARQYILDMNGKVCPWNCKYRITHERTVEWNIPQFHVHGNFHKELCIVQVNHWLLKQERSGFSSYMSPKRLWQGVSPKLIMYILATLSEHCVCVCNIEKTLIAEYGHGRRWRAEGLVYHKYSMCSSNLFLKKKNKVWVINCLVKDIDSHLFPLSSYFSLHAFHSVRTF